MKSFTKMFYFPLLFLAISSTSMPAWQNINGGRGDFVTDSVFHQLYGGIGNSVLGDFNATGNSILQVDDGSIPNLISSHTAFKDVDPAFHAAAYTMGDAEKVNSSSATLSLPSYVQGKDVVWAGLFWQGHIYRKDGTYSDAQVDADAANWNSITIKDANGTMHQITAPLAGNDTTHKAFHHAVYATGADKGYRYSYGAYYDITNIVKNSYSPTNQVFTVGNLKTTAGKDTGGYVYITQAPAYSGSFQFGLYGGWSLIVAYSVDSAVAVANNVPAKNISIYDGFELYLTWGSGTVPFTTTIDISGFYTPKSGVVNSKLLLFGGAGDKGIEDDTLQLQNKTNTGSYLDLNNIPNQAGRQFNHTYTYFGNDMTPGDVNKQGMDLDIYDVSDKMANGQTSTKIKFGVVKSGNHCDQLFPQVIGFSTQLYEPKFCYDYAYKQQGVYFTEDNNGSASPKLSTNNLPGSAIIGEPIDMSIYIRNQVDSDLDVTDMNASILDMNTSQVTYIRDSTELARIGQLTPQSIPDTSLTVSDSFVKGINIGTVGAQENFYLYYQLNPLTSTLDMPLDIEINYNLVIGGTTIPYTTKLGGSKIQMCSGGNFNYVPLKGIFNIVNDYYATGTLPSGYFNNLPTQIASREGSFKVLSMDPDNLDDLKGITTSVAIEMIDASAYHDVNASCNEISSAITERVWVIFDNNATSVAFDKAALESAIANDRTSLVNSYDFYQNARTNAAFRVSYNYVDDNTTLVDLESISSGGSTKYNIQNFTELIAYNNGDCAQDVDGNLNNQDKIPQYCSNAGSSYGSAMTEAQLATCMECVYGVHTKLVCSRDNFSIRPEAFMMQLDDQNQTNPTSQTDITTVLNSGSAGAIWPQGGQRPQVDLSAGYKYNIEVNATNHLNNTSTEGYTKTFNLTSADKGEYLWEPRGLTAAELIARNTACNDDSNKSITLRLVNGTADVNTSVDQVGEYRLHVLDTTWTKVDGDPAYMTHHTGSYFKGSDNPNNDLDCVANSSDTLNVGTTGLNGCEISSSHANNEATLQYNDYNVTFHPYSFVITNSVNLGFADPSNPDGILASSVSNPFVYMGDINNTVTDENMSVHFDSSITAVGENGTIGLLTNSVKGCYAQPLDINISKSATANSKLQLSFRYHDYNSSGSEIVANEIPNGFIDYGNEDINITFTTPANISFQKDLAGSINTRVNLNYNREVNASANPERITFVKYKVDDPNNQLYADLKTDKTAEGNVSIDQNVTFYYGRTAAKKTRVICDTGVSPCLSGGTEDDVFIYYEIYCFESTGGNWCTTASSIVPTDVNGNRGQKVDSRWFINYDHNETTYGGVTAINEPLNGYVTVPGALNPGGLSYIIDPVHSYNLNGVLPYTADMNDTVPRWLVHDENNASTVSNSHIVIFRGKTEWSGEHEADSKTKTDRVKRVNRRTMW